MMKFVLIMVATAMMIGSAGCATGSSGSAKADNPNCIQFREIRNWRAIDAKHIYVESPGEGNMFLFTLLTSCEGIDNTQDIWLSVRSGYLCANDMGEVLFRNGMIHYACPIVQIEKVSGEDHAGVLARTPKSGQ